MGIFYSKTLDDIVKEQKRGIDRSCREIDRDYRRMEHEETKLKSQLKIVIDFINYNFVFIKKGCEEKRVRFINKTKKT